MTPVTRGGRAGPFDHERATGRIREAFRRRYELQSEFAKALGWSEMKVSRMLRGETALDLPDLLHVCKVLRLSADWVLGIMPTEVFAAVGGPVGLVAVPFVTCEEAADDLAVASTDSVCHLPAKILAKAICYHEDGGLSGEWPFGRLVLCDISSAMFPPYGAAVLLDRRPDLSSIHGLHVLARFAPTIPPSPPATRAGYLACLSRRELDEVITFARAKDDASIRTLVERGRCVQLRDGVRVTVLERPSSGVVVFVVQGEPAVRFYTITEAIR